MRLLRNLNKAYSTVILLMLSFTASSQCFDADDVVGCPPHTITVTNCGDPAIPVFYDYGDGSGISFDNTHTYSSQGMYTVTQYAGTGSNIDTLEKVDYINILDNPEPQFTLENCANKTVQITINEDIYDNYIIDYGDGTLPYVANGFETITKAYSTLDQRTVTVTGQYDNAPCTNESSTTTDLFDELISAEFTSVEVLTENSTSGEIRLNFGIEPGINYKLKARVQGTTTFEILDTITSSTILQTYTHSGINTLDNAYEYELEAFDACGLTSLSNRVASINLNTNTTANSINLSWNTFSGTFDQYVLIKDGNPTDNGLSSIFIDNVIECNQTYCYQVVVEAESTVPAFYSYSVEKCIPSPVDTDPQPITGLNASFEDQLTLSWDTPSSLQAYTWQRAIGGNAYNSLGTFTTTANTKKDASASNTSENCYLLTYTDECNNSPAAVEVCAINLSITALDGANISLNWTPYNYFSSGLNNYIVDFIDDKGSILSSFDNGTSTSFTGSVPDGLNGNLSIRVSAISTDGSIVKSNTVTASFYAEIHFPNAFTPNEDGLNDVFVPKGQFIKTYDLYIYTRQGELIFHSTEINTGWDGFLPNGKKATEGVYSFVAEVTGTIGNKFTKKGTFTLLN